MRLLSVVVLATVALAVSAHAADTPSLSIRVSSFEVLYGHELILGGRVSADATGSEVGIYARASGQTRPARIASVSPSEAGYWVFRTRPATSTSYLARIGDVATPALEVEVEPVVHVRLLADRTILARVSGGPAPAGRAVVLERATRAGWLAIARTELGRGSRALLEAPVSAAALRLRVVVLPGASHDLLGAASHPFIVPATTVSLTAAATSVGFGGALELSGQISDPAAGQTVLILARSFGSRLPVAVASVTPGPNGRFAFPVEPVIETSYRAGWDGLESHAVVVAVRPSLSIAALPSGRVEAVVRPELSCRGCSLRLERAAGGGWARVAELPVSADGRVVFPAPIRSGSATLRLVLEVSEGATGFERAATAPIAYRARYQSVATSTVRFGGTVRLAGVAPAGRAGVRVTILWRPFGRTSPGGAAVVLTGAGGRWSWQTQTPPLETTYTVGDGARTVELRTIRVEPRIAAAPSTGGEIGVQVEPAAGLAGHEVLLQGRATGRGWVVLERARLDRRGAARLPAPTGARWRRLRVAVGRSTALRGAVSATFGARGA